MSTPTIVLTSGLAKPDEIVIHIHANQVHADYEDIQQIYWRADEINDIRNNDRRSVLSRYMVELDCIEDYGVFLPRYMQPGMIR